MRIYLLTLLLVPATSAVDPATAVTTVEKIVGAGDKLADIIRKTKDFYVSEIESQIKKINLHVEGINKEQRTTMEKARSKISHVERRIVLARANLESLAEETITRVNSMLHYLSLIGDDWSSTKIEKFLRFQAKKMSQLIDRSLILLNEAKDLYIKTGESLDDVKASLTSFQTFVENLASTNSAAHKKTVQEYRLAVYLPCFLACPVCAPIAAAVCVTALETEISKWKSALDNLNSIVNNNNLLTGKSLCHVQTLLGDMDKDTKLITKWQSALSPVKDVDWTFEPVEIFGFNDFSVPVIKSLNNLMVAAQNYLDGGRAK